MLATSVTCYVNELLKWFPNAARRPVGAYTTDQKAELNLATMPTVIVEAGFHTNPEDAVLLLDASFQTASMRGVEKGWRLYREGKPCTPFGLSFISDVSGKHNTAISIPLKYVGYPKFPVKAEFVVSNCPAGFDCTKQTITYTASTASPLPGSYTCKTANTTPTTKLTLDVQLIDADGAKTSIQRPQVTCLKP